MSTESVGRLAHDIAAQFAHLPLDEAGAQVAAHVRMFWDPSMRRQLGALVDEQRDDLEPVIVRAVDLLRGPGPGEQATAVGGLLPPTE